MFASNSLFMWHIWTIAQHAGPNHLGLWVANQGERERVKGPAAAAPVRVHHALSDLTNGRRLTAAVPMENPYCSCSRVPP